MIFNYPGPSLPGKGTLDTEQSFFLVGDVRMLLEINDGWQKGFIT